jgi:ABC-type lipoprotein export system ATPase subunit
MSSQYVYTMYRLSKAYPPDKQVLKDITLAFLPGAKIGVLGYNGAGKSTVLKIMAGIETDYRGDAMLAPGATVGLLEQEPQLDAAKDVRGNVEDGVAETKALLERFNELAANYSDETADEFARLQEQIDAADAWNLDTNVEYAMDALRLPPADADVERLSGGERPSTGWSATSPSTAARSSRSPMTATSSTTSRAGSSSSTVRAESPTRATTRRGWSRSRRGSPRRRSPRRPASGRSRPSWNGCARTPRAGARRPRRA